MNNMLATRMGALRPSPTFAAAARAKALMAEGRDIIDLTLGEPDFDTPDSIKAAGIAAIQRGDTKYTPVDGTAALKNAIAKKFKTQNGLDYSPQEISVGTGGKQVLYNSLMATVDVGDEVIIPAPYWVSYPDIVELAGGTPVFVSAGLETGFKITPVQLRAAITPKTKWFLLNSPSNPTGAAYTVDEIRALADVLKEHPNILILSDDLYEHITYDNFIFATIASIAPELKDRTLTLNGVSKAFSMTGWRIGYAGGPKWLIDAMRLLQSQSTSSPSSIAQAASVEALAGDQSFIQTRNAEFKARRDAAAAWLNAIPGVKCHVPEGAFYLFPSVEQFIGAKTPDGKTLENDTDIAMYLLDHAGVAMVMGSAFGAPGFLRISYATTLEKLRMACERIGVALGALCVIGMLAQQAAA